LNAYLWVLRSDATWGKGGPHSGYRHLADKDEVPGSSPGRPTTVLPAQSAAAPRPVAPTALPGPRRGRTPFAQSRPRPSRSRPPSAQIMVGLMPAIMSLTTCAQPCRRWANLAAYPVPYRRAVPSQPAPPGRPGGRARPLAEDLPTTTAKPTPPLAQHGLRQLRASGSDSGRRPAGRGYRAGRPRRLRPSSPCGCSPHRRA
jgi:hypothetical protein